jgi:hypothetical protein
MCTHLIVRHINSIPATEIFTTRHMLMYGIRKSVDSALGRLVADGVIHRLARGVFVRDLSADPTMVQIVEAKLKAWSGTVAVHAKNILGIFHLETGRYDNVFVKDGSSSSFHTIRGRAYFKNQCARKMRLYEEEVGRKAMALWHLRTKFFSGAVDILTASFNRKDRELFKLSASLKPAWLTAQCAHRYPDSDVCVKNPFCGKT